MYFRNEIYVYVFKVMRILYSAEDLVMNHCSDNLQIFVHNILVYFSPRVEHYDI